MDIDEWQLIIKLLFDSLYIDPENQSGRDLRSFIAKNFLIYMSNSDSCSDNIFIKIYKTFISIESINYPYDSKRFYLYVRKIKSGSFANMK